MAKLFFLVSGEHRTLPIAEIKAILGSEGIGFSQVQAFDRLICLNTRREAARLVGRRSSMARICCLELFRSRWRGGVNEREARGIPYREYLEGDKSFSVRFKTMGRKKVNSIALEREIGKIIRERVKGARVNLENPDVCFIGLITGSIMILGVKLAEVDVKSVMSRTPSRRPFVHPSTMNPLLARCTVNIARAAPGRGVLDPFCGSGSLMLEARDMGCRIYGCDVKKDMVKGCLRNLKHFGYGSSGLFLGDARRLPLTSIDCIVSDPPYGRSSTTLGASTRDLVLDFLSEAFNLVRRGGYVTLALPAGYNWREGAEDRGYRFVERHHVREHKSLTREILVVKRV